MHIGLFIYCFEWLSLQVLQRQGIYVIRAYGCGNYATYYYELKEVENSFVLAPLPI